MARRKQKHFVALRLSLRLVATLLCLWAFVTILNNLPEGSGTFFVLAVVAACAIVIVQKIVRPARLRQSLLVKANAVIEQQTDQLLRRRAQLVRQDAYGKVQLDKWSKEIEYFVTQHIGASLTTAERSVLEREREEIGRIISDRAERATRDMPVFQAFSDKMTPTEFEIFCAEQLRESGWDTRVTMQSRDQGVDVVAEKAGVRVVLQCKLYSGPVGNKAVQEIVAGKAHEQAHHGVVVTNSRYTSAAEQLASTNGVLLLHYSDLLKLETLLR